MNDDTKAEPLITIEEYKKLSDAIEQLYGIIWDNSIITPEVLDRAIGIYNNAEIRTFSEVKIKP